MKKTSCSLFVFSFCLFLCTMGSLQVSSAPIIHVFGDSHSRAFQSISNCSVTGLGPITMHRVGRDGLAILNFPALGVQDGQVVICTFGEIDVRCHIGKQKDLCGRSIEEITQTLATNYINTILNNRRLYQDLTCIIYSVVPPVFILGMLPEYPFYGTLEDRIAITKLLNETLAVLCKLEGLPFLDVYEDYANSEGSLILDLSDGNVHIHSDKNQAIIKKLDQILVELKKSI